MKKKELRSRKAYETPEVEDFELIGPLNILVQVSMDGEVEDFTEGADLNNDLG